MKKHPTTRALKFDRLSELAVAANTPFNKTFVGNATELQDLADHYGSQTAIANAMGVVPSALTQWGRRGIPLDVAFAFAYHSGGLLAVSYDALAKRLDPYYAHRVLEAEA
ncbi:MAG: hypothetical protein BWK73_25470 [Thiothrix lacustris]|uniref:Uncharacterized protein n=1 Tax=Thiothrix lacustris TaxID=525917 RepID=A0A1Y1QL80_9GAMM|nr:MAG: hypothetical protein BWK73_25470 [Thiothrix lacustris]